MLFPAGLCGKWERLCVERRLRPSAFTHSALKRFFFVCVLLLLFFLGGADKIEEIL